MSRPKIDFEKELKQLITRLEGVVSNVSQKSAVAESSSNGNNSKVVSCQLVNFNSESKNHNEYQVYNYCHSVKIYENELANYFTLKDKKGNFINKSVLSIFKDMDDDGVWYSQKEKKYTPKIIALEYNKPAPTTAVYEKYSLEKECRKQWKNWSNLMYTIYKDQAVSVFGKKIEIPISDSRTLYSGIYLTFACKLSYSQIGIIGRICGNLLNEIAFKDLMPGLYEDIENQATRAAISQVMARNTSHNIGAHVMNKLIGDLNYDTLFKKKNYNSIELITLYTETIKKWNQDRLKDNKLELTEEEQKQKILLDQISIFNNYVKCRMDYLADISFGTPLMQTNKYAYADLFKELDKVRLLLEHISGLDNFEFEIKFTRNGKEFKKDNQGEGEDDLLVAIPNDILGTQAFYNILENIIRNSAKHAQKPTEIDINGNSIKKTTVFTVNFIDTLEVDTNGEIKRVIDYCECIEVGCTKAHKKEIENSLNEFIVVEVYDNIPVEKLDEKLDLEESDIKEFNDKKTALPKDNKFSSYIDKLVFSQNKKLNEDILQENKLRSYSLGLVEMDASAAYLRKRPVEYINHRSYDIQYDESWSRNTEKNKEKGRDQVTHRGTNCRHFLKAFKKTVAVEIVEKENKETEIQNYLGYRFFLHRPAVVLVVTELLEGKKDDTVEKKKENKDKKDTLRKEGIWVIGKTEFEKELIDGKVYPHEFVIHTGLKNYEVIIKDGEPSVKLLEYFKTSLPLRILELNKDEVNCILEKDAEKIICECWIRWESKLKEKYNYSEYSNAIFPKLNSQLARISDHLHSSNENATPEKVWNTLIKNAYFVEPASSKSQSYLPCLKNQKLSIYPSLLKINLPCKMQMAECILSRVVVIDERVQQNCKQKPFGIEQHVVYKMMRIEVPETNINLADSNLNKNEIINFIKNKIDSCDFILIHYSILERMFQSENNRLESINSYLITLSEKSNVVVTSGRGVPDKLPKEVRFINLSSVIMAFNEVRGKYLINYLLNSTRKTNRI